MRFLMLLRHGFWVPYLLRHPAVPFRLKTLPFLALAYVIFPRDLILDLRLPFGLFDDVFVVSLLLGIFVNKAWRYVLEYDRRSQDSIDADFKVLIEEERAKARGESPGARRSATGGTSVVDHTPKDDLRNRS